VQAVRLHEGGELRVEEVPEPVAGPGEVVVELRAAAVNRRDLLVRHPPSPAYVFPLPLTPGSDGAGVRCDTGEEVVVYPGLDWGDRDECPGPQWRLLGGPEDGTYAELVKLPVANLFPKPGRFTWQEAAAFPLAALTAHRALFRIGELRPGETALVLGAGSGVSTFAVQLAAQAGARVFVTSSTDEKIERAKELGATGGVRYTDAGWAEAIVELAGGGVDVVLDSVGSTWGDSVRALGRAGRLVVFGATGGPSATVDVRGLYLGWRSIRGTTLGSARDFASLLEMVERGRWRPAIDSVYPLAAASAAHERLEGDHFGKIVLEP
jgi:zinc-binding alcohol dehydrogenase/oxidoreductase